MRPKKTAVAISGRIGLSQPVVARRIKRLRDVEYWWDSGCPWTRQNSLWCDGLLGIKLATASPPVRTRGDGAILEVQLVDMCWDFTTIARGSPTGFGRFRTVLRRRVATLPGVDVERNVLLSEERRLGPL
jgi:hypothetical protein